MDPSPTTQLIEQAIASATLGETRDYLVFNANLPRQLNERTLRNAFLDLRQRPGEPDGRELAFVTMRNLNAFYRTRYPLDQLRQVSDIAFGAVDEAGWWHSEPSAVLSSPSSDASIQSQFIAETLEQVSSARLNRCYSLITKWMHFLFPDSFAICDWQAACSIQTWSYFAYSLAESESERFRAGILDNPNGRGYGSVLEFYHLCWQQATSEQRCSLHASAETLSQEVGAPVGVIDIIDKLLWLANGDPRKLGLL